jgi:hypothetical protein
MKNPISTVNEYFKKTKDAVLGSAMSIFREERFGPIKGEVFWELRHADGRVEKGHIRNVVTKDASILLAMLMKGNGAYIANQSLPAFGVLGLAVGTGDVAWDPLAPPPGTNAQRSLFNELGRKRIGSSNFVNPNGTVSGIPTNVIDLTTVFTESEAVGPLCEMGLIGGDASTNMGVRNPVLPANGSYNAAYNLTGRDILVNYVTFPVISKPSNSTLGWTWRLSF